MTVAKPVVVACLGDSLTLGGTGAEKHSWISRLTMNNDLFPQVVFANFGKSGSQSADYLSRYTSMIKGKGYAALVITGCINDVTNDVLATTSWANIEAIVNDAILDELPVYLVPTTPFGSNADFTAGRQTQLLALRALFAAKAGVTYLDLYTAGGRSNDPTKLKQLWDFGDGKHYGVNGNIGVSEFFAPTFLAAYPPPVVPTSVGITKANVLAIASELSSPLILDSDWTLMLGWAQGDISPDIGSQDKINRCATWLAAHMLSELLSRRKGGSGSNGPVTAIRVDKLAKNFQASDAWKTSALTAAVLQTTPYGREYLRLIRIFLGGSATVAGGLGPIGSGWPNC